MLDLLLTACLALLHTIVEVLRDGHLLEVTEVLEQHEDVRTDCLVEFALYR